MCLLLDHMYPSFACVLSMMMMVVGVMMTMMIVMLIVMITIIHRLLPNENIPNLYGACLLPPKPFVVLEYAEKGSVADLMGYDLKNRLFFSIS